MGILLIVFMATCFLRWWSGMPWQDATSVGISGDLLVVAGLSAAVAGGAKITTGIKAAAVTEGPTASDAKVTKEIQPAAVTEGAAKKTPSDKPHFWEDLFHNDAGYWDIGDAQMILVTAVSIVLFVVNVCTLWADLPLAAHIDLPSPTNALTLAFGGSLGGYLAKKIGGTIGLS